MKKLAKIFTAMMVLLSMPLDAQIRIGSYTLANPPAPMLSPSIGAGGYKKGFFAAVRAGLDNKALLAACVELRAIVAHDVAPILDELADALPDALRIVK
jgi:hypothetical protein